MTLLTKGYMEMIIFLKLVLIAFIHHWADKSDHGLGSETREVMLPRNN